MSVCSALAYAVKYYILFKNSDIDFHIELDLFVPFGWLIHGRLWILFE